MRILLVNPPFPQNFWSGKHGLKIAGRKCLQPPLGLLTVAALLPRRWRLRLVDLNVSRLSDEEIRQFDIVMITAMMVQRLPLQDILSRCRALGVRTVVGGPYATIRAHELEALADHVVIGEAEEIACELAADLEAGSARPVYREPGKPDMSRSPIPRFDLIDPRHYLRMSLQYSRGCPFTCEFCDIPANYGRTPRTKSSGQVLAELEAIRATGFRGEVFFVDDNFIGNRQTVKQVLEDVARWRRLTRPPLSFFTDASINLADDDTLVRMMTDAGFTSVFIGVETPSKEALREVRKLQNLNRDMVGQIHSLLEQGLAVSAGLILGFDNDGPDTFDRMIEFVQEAAIPRAIIGLLTAIPNTPLYERLESTGRLKDTFCADQTVMTNVVTRLPEAELLAGYRRVLETLYHPDVYFERCRKYLSKLKPAPGSALPMGLWELASLGRAFWRQGVISPYRASYWRFLQWAVREHPSKLSMALDECGAGHHFITYTRNDLPSMLSEVP